MRRIALLPLFVLCLTGSVAGAQTTKPTQTPFVRFVADGRGGGTLDAAITRYTNDKGVTVDLVGTFHIAEAGYYGTLDARFDDYDAVLYEMVKPEGAPAPNKGMRGDHPIGRLQVGMQEVLGLAYQLDAIDYRRDNFVHADLTAEEFTRLNDERGEGMLSLIIRAIANQAGSTTRPATIALPELLQALAAPDRTRQMKLLMSRQFGDIDTAMALFDGPQGSVLITERNKAAIDVLKKVLHDGEAESIALFYGAGHMRDLEPRLIELGFKLTQQEWLVAWDMRIEAAPATAPATRPVDH